MNNSSIRRQFSRRRMLFVTAAAACVLPAAMLDMAGPAVSQAGGEVDLILVLAVDCSYSVDAREFRLQMDGIGHAFRSAEVHRAIQSGPLGRIAVTVFQWSDAENQTFSTPWTVIDSDSTANAFADRMFKNIAIEDGKVLAEDILREINRGGFSTGYCGQSPERLKAHMRNQDKFDLVSLRAPADTPEVGGEYYGLPWPCWGTPEMKHPGSPILYRTDVPVWEGGGTFRARFGVERNGETLLAEDSYSEGSQLTDGYPEFNYGILRKLGWDADLRPEDLATIQRVGGDKVDAVSWATDLSGGIQRVCMDHGVMHYGNGKARVVAWNLPDPVPVHREPIYTPRPDLVEKYPTRPDERQFRIPNIGYSVQQAAIERNVAGNFPILLTSGRLVEYEGGGEETRSNRWLAELQQEMFVEINPADATARGVEDGQYVWVYGTENDAKTRVKALVTERVAPGVAFMPFHFSGHYQGEDWREHYPAGTDPIVLGESVNTITTYGFDPVTGMQETKVVLCQIAAA